MKFRIKKEDGKVSVSKVCLDGAERLMFQDVKDGECVEIDVQAQLSVNARKLDADDSTIISHKDPYKAGIIEKHLEKYHQDDYYLVRLTGDSGNPINIGEDALLMLKSYYEGREPV